MTDSQTIQRIYKKVSVLAQRQQTETWVTAKTLMSLTIWNSKGWLRAAREQGLVKWKAKGEKTKLYLVESVNPIFLIQNQNT